jgi:hypothetical protein
MPTASATDFAAAQATGAVGALPSTAFTLFEDFALAPSGTIPPPWTIQDTSAAGTPTKDYVADAAGGVHHCLMAATNEAEVVGYHHGDQRMIDITKAPIIEFRVKFKGTAAAVFAAGERWVVGLASDYNATFDSTTTLAWFRHEGAGSGRAIVIEGDDGTTDTDDQACVPATSWAEDTFLLLKIDCTTLSAVKFYINGVYVGSVSMPLATGTVQPVALMQKDSGTTTPDIFIDYCDINAGR